MPFYFAKVRLITSFSPSEEPTRHSRWILVEAPDMDAVDSIAVAKARAAIFGPRILECEISGVNNSAELPLDLTKWAEQHPSPGLDAWLRETAAHLRSNSIKLAKYPGMKKEARARELAALYIEEIATTHGSGVPVGSNPQSLRSREAGQLAWDALADGVRVDVGGPK